MKNHVDQYSEKAMVENLKDAGCNVETIQNFLNNWKQDKKEDGLKLLGKHRRFLLDALHQEQKQIDCLDYLVYRLQK